MRIPKQTNACNRIQFGYNIKVLENSVRPLGNVVNRSTEQVWITAGGQRHCLKPGESSDDVGINDGDGILLNGHSTLFDSLRIDLGGGRIHSEGAIKVCSLGTLTVYDASTVDPQFIVRITNPGLICPGDSAGHKTLGWCQQKPGWDIPTTPVARTC
jgi:hypothetical protein